MYTIHFGKFPLLHINWLFQSTQCRIHSASTKYRKMQYRTEHQNKQLIKNKHFLLNRQERAGVLQYLTKRLNAFKTQNAIVLPLKSDNEEWPKCFYRNLVHSNVKGITFCCRNSGIPGVTQSIPQGPVHSVNLSQQCGGGVWKHLMHTKYIKQCR